MRFLTSFIAVPIMVAGLAACSPPVPDSAAGVGFEDYDRYLAERQARDRQLAQGAVGQNVPAQSPIVTPAPGVAGAAPRTAAEQTAADAVAAIRPQTPVATPQVAQAPVANNEAISDEQDFNAVSSRQSIQSDAQRRAQQSAQYEVVQPTAVPRRPGGTSPTPIEFALQVKHPVGQKVYTRSPFGSGKQADNCAAYASGELAQDAFLKAGGPERDKLKLDFDGDGYACGWNPSKYRKLVRG